LTNGLRFMFNSPLFGSRSEEHHSLPISLMPPYTS
jgi:hypothetical protein